MLFPKQRLVCSAKQKKTQKQKMLYVRHTKGGGRGDAKLFKTPKKLSLHGNSKIIFILLLLHKKRLFLNISFVYLYICIFVY